MGTFFWMIDKLSSSAKFSVFMHNVLDIAGSSLSCSFIFYMGVMSVVLYMVKTVNSSPF